ncbi:cation-transporting P-type ATPase, partial [Enterococcus faecium]
MSEENKKEQLSQAFYAQEAEAVLKELQTDANGLTNDEAKSRLSQYGANELEEGKK